MNLRGIANSITSLVNPNVPVTVLRSTGFTVGVGMKQVPSYAPPLSGMAQIQALDNYELELTAGLNLQGDVRSIYFHGALAGAFRADSKGGDIVTTANGSTWLVTKILESWPDWTKAVIVRQAP